MEWADERIRPTRFSMSSKRRERISMCPASGWRPFYSVSREVTRLSSIWRRRSRSTQSVFSIFGVFLGLKNFEQTRDGHPSRREWDSARHWTWTSLESASYRQSSFQDSIRRKDLEPSFIRQL